MKRVCLTVCVFGMLATAACAQELPAPGSADAPPLKTTTEKASYAIGLNIGGSIQAEGLELNVDLVIQGIRDAIAKRKPLLTEEEIRTAMGELEREVEAAQAERRKVEAEKNKKEGPAFLAANKTKPGVKTLESGLQYKVLQAGTGPSPKITDTVRTHYRGTLIDGTPFDSSFDRGEPAVFPVAGVIRGWTEALQQMKVGDKWQLFIPSELAYGSRGAGGVIGPDAVLVFEIELLGIEP